MEDLEWLREQVTVMEVNFARVHNVSHRPIGFLQIAELLMAYAQWDVKR